MQGVVAVVEMSSLTMRIDGKININGDGFMSRQARTIIAHLIPHSEEN